MIFNAVKKNNYEYIVIDDFYDDTELIELKEEIDLLLKFKLSPEYTGAAKKENAHIKKGDALWVDYYFSDRSKSKILTLNRKLFEKTVVDQAKEVNLYFSHIDLCNCDWTLLNFYENGGTYKPHTDTSALTAITMFKIGDFTGGDLHVVDDKIEFKENRLIIFPGCLMHEAKPIIAEPNNYRVTMAQFINYKT